jgi:antitoxin component of MazEF toxin-antitoxin module
MNKIVPIPTSLQLQSHLVQWGNDLGIRITHPLAKVAGITLTKTADGLITLAPKRRHTLADLIAQCDLKAVPPADMAIWDAVRPL